MYLEVLPQTKTANATIFTTAQESSPKPELEAAAENCNLMLLQDLITQILCKP